MRRMAPRWARVCERCSCAAQQPRGAERTWGDRQRASQLLLVWCHHTHAHHCPSRQPDAPRRPSPPRPAAPDPASQTAYMCACPAACCCSSTWAPLTRPCWQHGAMVSALCQLACNPEASRRGKAAGRRGRAARRRGKEAGRRACCPGPGGGALGRAQSTRQGKVEGGVKGFGSCNSHPGGACCACCVQM